VEQVEEQERRLEHLTQSSTWKAVTAEWGGIGVKLSMSSPYLIEAHASGAHSTPQPLEP